MRRFFLSLSMSRKRNSTAGLIFNGRQIDKLTRESSLVKLEQEFREESDEAQETVRYLIQYLRSCKNIYSMCCKKKLDPNYVQIIEDFRIKFDVLYRRGFLYETPKVNSRACNGPSRSFHNHREVPYLCLLPSSCWKHLLVLSHWKIY